jgi:hypothetical protein
MITIRGLQGQEKGRTTRTLLRLSWNICYLQGTEEDVGGERCDMGMMNYIASDWREI